MQRAARPIAWIAALTLLGGLAWQGHRIAHLLPEVEQAIEAFGVWGPVVYVVGVVLLAPLLVPDTLFGVTAGVVFGLGAGFVYYFAGVYVACLCAALLGRRWLRRRVLAALATRPALAGIATAAEQQGLRLTLWIRLVPLNPAAVSYALGAAGVPLRAVAVGSLAMFPHMFLTVYLGAAAAHITRMAGAHPRQWSPESVALLLGLAACGGLVMQISKLALRQVRAAQAEGEDPGDGPPV